jgi:hypothetical protein
MLKRALCVGLGCVVEVVVKVKVYTMSICVGIYKVCDKSEEDGERRAGRARLINSKGKC